MNSKSTSNLRASLRRALRHEGMPGGERLEIWLPPQWPREDAELGWRRVSADGRAVSGRQRGLDGLPAAGHIIVWTPAGATLLLRARLPTRAPAKILQALPYALEEQLIEPPEQQHFAFTHEPDGALAVAVTSVARMDAWLGALKNAGLAPDVLAPVTLSLPYTADAWTIAFTPDEIVLRTGAYSGFGGPREPLPPAWLRFALEEARAEERLPQRLLFVDPPADLDLAAWEQALGVPTAGPAVASASAPAAFVPAPLNLLQHRYASRGRWTGVWRAYRPAALLVAAAFIALLAADVVELARLAWATRAAEDEMRTLFLKSFPDTKTVLDPAQQMQRGVDRLLAGSAAAAPGDLLALLARAGPVLEREPRMHLQAIEYADGQMTVRFTATESTVASAVIQLLRGRSLDVELQKPPGAPADEMRLRIRAQSAGAQRANR